ncbi:MAG TPA: hypothetical protein EYM80_06845 [Deltaproteobacteria bacterium]|nr:hypothetical protein [SAR324 cluster bacterium]HBL54957.1 hypothetical protein [Deltaproteobacteria bacterium]HHZ79277.1 hypothetical protein [Candidatus Lambdaproteobacteria bacterium]HIA56620.1 hypothetical protein [Candidatus Lambdaproteobacteria bacterium]HIN47922.1 hypothetical protein [Deltaproteobacteria bacterium]
MSIYSFSSPEALRKLIVLSCVFLILSGILLAYPRMFPWAEESSATSLLHIWAGFFFLVIFPMYSWDHIRGHKDRLGERSLVTASGIIQFFTGLGLIISGIPLLLYGADVLDFPREIHLLLTFVLAGSLILHKFSKK